MRQLDVIDWLGRAGWRRTIEFSQKEHVIQALIYDTVICRRQSAIDQFIQGLSAGKVLDLIRAYPEMTKKLFVFDAGEELNAER